MRRDLRADAVGALENRVVRISREKARKENREKCVPGTHGVSNVDCITRMFGPLSLVPEGRACASPADAHH